MKDSPGPTSRLGEALVGRRFPRLAAALVIAGLLHVLLFVLLHVRPGPPPAPKPVVDVVPYVETTDVQLAAEETVSVAPASAPAATAHVAPVLAPPARGPEPSTPVAPVTTEEAPATGAPSGTSTTGLGVGTGAGVSVRGGTGDGAGPYGAAVVMPRVDRAALLAQVLARVRSARRYPEAARRRELEGVVHVRFTIGGDGRPLGIATADGDALLQRAAVEAVERAAPLPLVDGPIDVDLDYRLDASQ
ncbi:MAG: TonB family protein [Polyangia bacterium]